MEKETLHIKIYRATDTFLYLPVYIAEDLKIMKTILEEAYKEYIFEVDFITTKNKGDEGAISEMLEKTDENTIAIAIGSPVAFLNSKEKKFEDVKIVGAIINKLTFWALARDNHSNDIKNTAQQKKIEEIAAFEDYFENIIYPNREYVTAHYLGKKIETEAKIANSFHVEFGAEIDNTTDKNKVVVLTADIVSLSTAMSNSPYRFKINYSFPKKQGEFLTTGIITSKLSCERFPGIIEKIIDSIQMSVAVFYTSRTTAINNCIKVVERLGRTNDITDDSIGKIVDLMYDEEFYPKHDLRVTRESWGEAVKAFLPETTTENANAWFIDYVNNDFVLKSTTKRLSIDLDAPRNTAPCKQYTNGGCPENKVVKMQLEETKEKYKNLQGKIKLLWAVLSIMILAIGTIIASLCSDSINKWVTVVASVVGIVTFGFGCWKFIIKQKHSNEERQSN